MALMRPGTNQIYGLPTKGQSHVQSGGGNGGGGYVAKAVNFDGNTTLYTSALQGGAASSVGTFFHWYKASAKSRILSTTSNFASGGTQPDGVRPIKTSPNPHNLYINSSSDSEAPLCYEFQGNTNDFVNDFGVYANVDVETDTWQLTAFSWNTAADAGSRTYQILQNGVLQTVVISWEDGGAIAIDWSQPLFFIGSFGWNFNGTDYVLSEPFEGDSSDMLLDVNHALDLSDPSVIAKIISSGKPVDQGGDGSLLTGAQPLIYLGGSRANYGTNLGYGGDFAVGGTLTDATTSPSD